MENIVLKTFKGGNVTPQDDAIIYQAAIPGAGIFKGCEVTVARGNVLHISQGFGMIKGRFFEMYENEISVQLADTGVTLKGRVYIHLDLSNADEPISIKTITTDNLPSLDMDSNINYNNSIYELELAVFTVDSVSIQNLNQTFSLLKGGSGGGGTGGNAVEREHPYKLGDTATNPNAPGWCTLVCTQAGATAIIEPLGYSQITNVGDKVLDGNCVFEARNTFGEIDTLADDIADAKQEITDLQTKFDASQSDVGALVMKLLSVADYKNLKNYDSNTMYYCYEDENTKQITAIYLGQNTIYATGIDVNYHIDSDYVIKHMASLSNEVISSAPEAELDGYEFVGWREDNVANKSVLSKKVVDSDKSVDLYAVFKRDIEIGMMDNGASLIEGKKESHFEDVLYYNNGNAKSEGIIIPECPYEMEGKSFCGWNTDCYSDPTYKPGKKGTFSDDSILFPMFIDTEYDFPFTGNYTRFVIPADGIYECELWGASGGDAVSTFANQNRVAKGGKGGHVKAYKEFAKGDVIFIMNGGKPNGNGSGDNGGGYGYSYTNSSTQRHYGAGGGGASHIALSAGEISTSNPFITYANRDKMLLMAGGGGGGGITGATSSAEGTYHDGGDGGGDRGGDGSSGTTLGGRQTSTGMAEDTGFLKAYSFTGSTTTYSGGGGGWFCGQIGSMGHSGAGGSGYIGGMPTFTKDKVLYKAINEAGVNEGNGYSFIRYVKCI